MLTQTSRGDLYNPKYRQGGKENYKGGFTVPVAQQLGN